MRHRRHAAILRLVRDRPIGSQEELRQALAGEGITAAQGTLSRDIRVLGLVKTTDGDGRLVYAAPAGEPAPPPLDRLLALLVTDVDGVGAFLVLRTVRGGAAAVSAALDGAGWPELLGAIPGEDVVLLITRGPRQREEAAARLETLLG